VSDSSRALFDDLFDYRQRTYAFYGIWADEYQRSMQTRSASWQTVWLRSRDFQNLRSPIRAFL
jgi:hypothetical protein